MKKHPPRIHLLPHLHLPPALRRALHVVWYGLAIVAGLVALLFVTVYLLLPRVAEKKSELEAFLTQQSGYTVQIEQLGSFWYRAHPGLQLQGLSVFAPGETRPAVQLAELRISLKLLPLLVGRVEIHSLVLRQPQLALERLADGRFRISGLSAIETPDAAQNETFVTWLFRQGELAIEDGALHWTDRREPERALDLTHVNLQLRTSGEHHRLGIAAEFPGHLCDDCALIAEIQGNPFLQQAFDGRVYVRGREIDVERLPRLVREQLPETLRGTFSVETWSEWIGSRPALVDGAVAVSGLRLPLAGLRAPLSVKQAATRLHWEREADGFDLALDGLTLALHGAPWSAGQLRLERREDRAELQLNRIELADVTAFVADLHPADAKTKLPYQEFANLWTELKPAGAVKDLRLRFAGALDTPEDFTLSATLEALAVEPRGDWPGVRGANAKLRVERDGGEIALDLRNATFAMPRVFRAPLAIAQAGTTLRWKREDEFWAVSAKEITLRNDDLKANGRLELRLPHDDRQSPYMLLRADFRDGNGHNAARYYPVHQLAPTTLAWMERAFGDGTVTEGTLVFDGRMREFPFAAGDGKFEIHAKVREAVYHFLPGWEPVTGAATEVTIVGERFTVTGQGQIGLLKATEIVVGNPAAVGTVQVRTNISGPVSESLRVLRAVKAEAGADDWRAWLPPSLEVAGNGTLSLDLAIPTDGRDTTVRGEYRFLHSSLRLAGVPAAVNDVVGSLAFSGAGVHAGTVRGKFLGGETALVISTPRADETLAVIQGEVKAAGLVPMLGPALAGRVNGAATWRTRLRLLKDRSELEAEADLSQLKLSLPAPLDRPGGVSADKLVVRTETANRDGLTLGVGLGNLLQGRLRYGRPGGWHLVSGRLVFNEAPARTPANLNLEPVGGLRLLLRLERFDFDQWLALLEAKGAVSPPSWLPRISAEMRALTMFDREFGRTSLELTQTPDGTWHGAINNAAVEGRIRIGTAPATRIDLDLARLAWLPASHPERDLVSDPRKLPSLTIKAKSLQVKDKEVGEFDFAASPMDQGWKIERFVLTRPETRFEASGTWRMEGERPASEFTLRLTSQDLGKALADLGMPDQLKGTELQIGAQLAWRDAPMHFSYPTLNGNIDIDGRKGTFLKLEQGAGRVFGLLDLSAIGRYLTLDFTPVFGQGFVFDRVSGKIRIDRGSASSNDFEIRGPSARITTNGRVGLVAEDFDLTLEIYPSLADSITIGSLAAGGPVAALWSLLIQKIFKKQITESTRVTYFVKGPWAKPDITRKVIEAQKPDPGQSG